MVEGKGGVFGSFVMVRLKKGNSMQYPSGGKTEKVAKAKITGEGVGASNKSPIVYVKDPVAKFFGFEIISPTDILGLRTKEIETTINGQKVKTTRLVAMGSTGASRVVRVRFAGLQNIGGKKVASVNIPMPSSHRFTDMVAELTQGPKKDVIAQIISPDGKAMTFKAAYNPKKKAGK